MSHQVTPLSICSRTTKRSERLPIAPYSPAFGTMQLGPGAQIHPPASRVCDSCIQLAVFPSSRRSPTPSLPCLTPVFPAERKSDVCPWHDGLLLARAAERTSRELKVPPTGDRGQPVCFYCSSHGYPCVYSQERRRPGPQRGLRRAAARSIRSSPLPPGGAHSQHHHAEVSHSPQGARESTSPHERLASSIGLGSNGTGERPDGGPPWPPVDRPRAETRGAWDCIRPHEEGKL